jgi:Ca2+-binding RTX toxin-like protein
MNNSGLAGHQGSIAAISGVILEEVGHWVDRQINTTDAVGDEGAIFAALVQGESLSSEDLQLLRAEDDRTVVILDGQSIAIEQQNFTGTAGNDTITGTNQDDVIDGLGGNDNLSGLAGNDTINGGDGDDYLNTVTGVDIVVGGAGTDRLEIDNRNDTANITVTYIDPNNGTVSGGSNNGTTFKEVERITLRTGSGNDTINIPAINIGFYSADVFAGAGNDVITTGSARDRLNGEAGNDTLNAGAGDDELYGGSSSKFKK